jgi:hypothetical protein
MKVWEHLGQSGGLERQVRLPEYDSIERFEENPSRINLKWHLQGGRNFTSMLHATYEPTISYMISN